MRFERAFIAMGSNIRPELNLPRAVRLLARRLEVLGVSGVYETAPVGTSGVPFLNAAALVVTDLSPRALKHAVLRPIEAELGRVRTHDKYAPRTIDLDIALFGSRIVRDLVAGVVIPDPDILAHPHVVVPLADLAPMYRHPSDGRTLGAIAAGMAGLAGIRLRLDVLPGPTVLRANDRRHARERANLT